jgi:DtxR family Mn-dependent transcriptional regulator
MERNMLEPLLYLLGGALFTLLIFWFFRPERGVWAKWQRSSRMNERILIEDALKHIHNYEMSGDHPTIHSIAGALQISDKDATELVTKIEAAELAQRDGNTLRLTSSGKQSALHILRAHRLWERYLADSTGFSESEWHTQADLYEHRLSSAEAEALSAQLGHPAYDPHGDPIPLANGELISVEGTPLTHADLDILLRIVHIEDEPQAIYDQLLAEGLHPGMVIRLLESTPQRVRIWAEGDEHILAPIVANNISIAPVPEEQECDTLPCEYLSELEAGEEAIVAGISVACRGFERRRLLDLGVLPGTTIRAAFSSPSGDPMAYVIRDALIALRDDQAKLILISRPEKELA